MSAVAQLVELLTGGGSSKKFKTWPLTHHQAYRPGVSVFMECKADMPGTVAVVMYL